MASFTSDLHTVRQRCDRALLQRAQVGVIHDALHLFWTSYLFQQAPGFLSICVCTCTSIDHMDRTQHQHQQAEKAEREARAELYEAVGERDDYVRRAARYGGVHLPVTGSGNAYVSHLNTTCRRAYQEMEGRRLLGLKQAMLAAAKAEKAHCQMRMQEAEALEVMT